MDEEQPPPYFIEAVPGLQQRTQTPSLPPRAMSMRDLPDRYEPPKLSWCEDSQKNKPQSNSLAAAVLIFTSGGMNLAWSLGFSPLYADFPQAVQPYEPNAEICWFLAVIVGSLLGSTLIDILQKRVFNLWASGLVLIHGILFVSVPDNIVVIILARYCDGLAVGMTLIAAIVAGSEQAMKRFRGIVLIAEPLGIMTGIMLRTIFASTVRSNKGLNSNRVQGLVAIVIGILALVCSIYLTIESAVFFLRRNNEEEAMNSLKRLQTPSDVINETRNLYENKDLLKEDIGRGHLKNMQNSYQPMMKVCVYRVFVAMSFSLPLNWTLVYVTYLLDENDQNWSSYIYGIMRLVGVIISLFTLDTLGRKGLTSLAMLIGGALLVGVGSIGADDDNLEFPEKLMSIITLLCAYQLFAGIAAPASTVYLGEAFSVSVKPTFILIAVVLENVVQVIISLSFRYTISTVVQYTLILGIFQIVFAVCFFFIMPETKQTTLREALNMFKRKLNIDYKLKFIRVNK